MTIAVDTANAAMTLVGGVLTLLAALLTLLVAVLPPGSPMETVRTLASRAASAIPQALALVAVVIFIFLDSQRIGLVILGVALVALSIQFLRRPGPPARIETFALVFQSCMFASLAVLYLLSRLTGVLEMLVKVLPM